MKVINVDHTPYSTKPELWEVNDHLYLVYPLTLVTGKITNHLWTGSELIVHTQRNSYRIDWAPTLRVMTKDNLIYERNLIRPPPLVIKSVKDTWMSQTHQTHTQKQIF